MARSDWYRLDNVGKFYAAQAGRSAQTVFRFSATMSDPVDPEALQAALGRAVTLFPGFNVSLRSGMFWHYLEPAEGIPAVQAEELPPCTGLHAGLESVLFRVSWHACRINVEMSHIVSDGRGTLEFFRALLAAYVEERYGDACAVPENVIAQSRRTEDSYTMNFERAKAGAGKRQHVYHLPGWKDASDPVFMEYHLSADEVHALAKGMGVSITSLMIAAVVKSIASLMPASARDRAICVNVPVDLRELFGSDTLRNFFGLAFVSYSPQDHGAADAPLVDIARDVQAQILEVTQPDALKRRMNRMVKLEKNPILRIAPLFLKDAILSLADRIAARDVTTTVSSIGRIRLDPVTAAHVRDINVLTSTQGLNFVLCTFGDVLSVGISSIYVSAEIIRRFCAIFTDLGIRGQMSVSRDAAAISHALKQAKLEEALRPREGAAKGAHRS